MNTHDKIELPEHDCLYESTNEQGYIDLEPAYRKSTVLRLLEADRKRRGLTDEKIRIVWKETKARMGVGGDPVLWFARAIERAHGISAPQPAEPDKQHPDDVAVDAFAAAMKAKLKRAREEKGRGGWQDMSATVLSDMLREHVEKGDPVDVANLAMMLHQNGQGIAPAEPVKYWLCCGSTDPTHADRKQPDCYDPDKAKFGTAESHKDSPAEPVKRKRRYAQGTALGEFGIIPMCDQVDDEPVDDEPVKAPKMPESVWLCRRQDGGLKYTIDRGRAQAWADEAGNTVVEFSRQAASAKLVKVPSDEAIESLAKQFHREKEERGNAYCFDWLGFGRALIAAYGQPAQPDESVKPDRYIAVLLGGQDGMPAHVWHDIIRSKLGRTYDFYMGQLDRAAPQPAEPIRTEDQSK